MAKNPNKQRPPEPEEIPAEVNDDAREESALQDEKEIEAVEIPLEKIGILSARFCSMEHHSPHHLTTRCFRQWTKDQVIRDQKEIDLLLSLGAPLEVYTRDVHGAREG